MSFSINTALRKAEREKQRAEAKAGSNCAICKHAKHFQVESPEGKQKHLKCLIKNSKPVTKYNLCHHFQGL